jgi:hypothetical protein
LFLILYEAKAVFELVFHFLKPEIGASDGKISEKILELQSVF